MIFTSVEHIIINPIKVCRIVIPGIAAQMLISVKSICLILYGQAKTHHMAGDGGGQPAEIFYAKTANLKSVAIATAYKISRVAIIKTPAVLKYTCLKRIDTINT